MIACLALQVYSLYHQIRRSKKCVHLVFFFLLIKNGRPFFLFLLEKIKRIVIVKNERRQTWRERGCLAPGLTAQHGPCEFHGPCVQTCVETRDDRPPALVARGYLQGENRWGKCTYVTSLNLLQSPISLS